MISYCKKDGLFWIRFFGYGVHIKDTSKHALLFSERELGHGSQLGKYRIKFLRKVQV